MQSLQNKEIELFLSKSFPSQSMSLKKRQLVYHSFDKYNLIGQVIKGCVCLVLITPDNGERMITYYEKGEYFTSNLISSLNDAEVYAIMSSAYSEVTIWKASGISRPQGMDFLQIENKILHVFQQKILTHLDILFQSSIRTKLLCFFEHRARSIGTFSFQLPFFYSDLANYLSIDRSSMMREIRKLKQDGTIQTESHRIHVAKIN